MRVFSSLPCHLQSDSLPTLMLCSSILTSTLHFIYLSSIVCHASLLFSPPCHVKAIYEHKFDWKGNSSTFVKNILNWTAITTVLAIVKCFSELSWKFVNRNLGKYIRFCPEICSKTGTSEGSCLPKWFSRYISGVHKSGL